MIPIGLRSINLTSQEITIPDGLVIMKASKQAEKKTEASLTSGTTTNKMPEPKKQSSNSKLITMPVRSGTQYYARDGDLIVTAAVNPGGECFANGNIHIYGPLRGKALAGVNGNEKSRIFCASLEAELIAIAGHYLTRDQMNPPKINKPMIQIYLKDGKIQIDGI